MLLPSAPESADLYALDTTGLLRVQVKSSIRRAKGGFAFNLTRRDCNDPAERRAYSTEEVDEFFLVTVEGGMYRVSAEVLDSVKSVYIGGSNKWAPYRVSMFS